MADRNLEASRPAVLFVGFSSADNSPSSTILATWRGYAEHFTDLANTPRILMRNGVFTGSCPSVVDLFQSSTKYKLGKDDHSRAEIELK